MASTEVRGRFRSRWNVMNGSKCTKMSDNAICIYAMFVFGCLLLVLME